tara:strand:- start:1064 stop:2083 length:1020 start_codon:yes stop_codon:yes gene_type:complete
MTVIRAAVIGLGQSGFFLDLDPARKEIWSHSKAIAEHEKTNLVAVVDEDRTKKSLIDEYHSLQKSIYFENIDEMLLTAKPEFVSVCSPTPTHLEMIKKIASCSSVRYVFCEKPVGISPEETNAIISICNEREIILSSNYMRRWDSKYRYIKGVIEKKKYGNLLAVNANGATALMTSASHLIDLMIYFSGSIEEVSGSKQINYVRRVHGIDDYGANAFFRFKNGATGHLKASSKSPEYYMFEIDLQFELGRIEVKDDGNEIIESEFKKVGSNSGSDYMSLVKNERKIQNNQRLLDAISDITDCKFPCKPISNGDNALEVQKIIQGIMKSSDMKGAFEKIG